MTRRSHLIKLIKSNIFKSSNSPIFKLYHYYICQTNRPSSIFKSSNFQIILLPFHQPDTIEAGCDEAGRGCLCGPVVAAAVILPADFSHPLLNDSKKMTETHREELKFIIKEKAIAWSIAEVDHEEIDRINILKASFKAMHLALDGLSRLPELLLIDGNRFIPYKKVPHLCMIKGDGRFASIAAASVLAKTRRDEIMRDLHEQFPHYGWEKNKGYGTVAHRNAIQKHGMTPFHRKTFQCLPPQLSLGLK